MYLIWITVLTFLATLSLAMGIYRFRNRSHLNDVFSKPPDTRFKPQPFLESLWRADETHFQLDELLRIAYIGTVFGAVIGISIAGLVLAFLLALLGFCIGPRIYITTMQGRFRRQFNRQYTQVATTLASSQRAGETLLESMRYISQEYPSPTKEIFKRIVQYTENNMPMHKAILQTAKEYKISELANLADTIRVIQELGGGEKSADILESVAKNIHFMQRCEDLIKSGTAKIKQTGLIATAIPLTLFAFFTMDPYSEYRAALYDPDAQVWLLAGVVATVAGWVITQYMIKKAKEL